MLLFAAKPLDLNSLHSILNSFLIMQALGEGPRQRRRMDGRGLEMTTDGKRHIGEDGIPDVRDHHAPVISSSGNMLHENTVKIATATMSREIFLVVGNTGLFNPQAACGASYS